MDRKVFVHCICANVISYVCTPWTTNPMVLKESSNHKHSRQREGSTKDKFIKCWI